MQTNPIIHPRRIGDPGRIPGFTDASGRMWTEIQNRTPHERHPLCLFYPGKKVANCSLSHCFSAAGAYLPPGGRWAAARRLGRGIREITLDVVLGKDLQKLYPFIGLILLLCRRVSARIPLPPPVATLPPAPSPRGKGLRPTAAVAPEGRQVQFSTER